MSTGDRADPFPADQFVLPAGREPPAWQVPEPYLAARAGSGLQLQGLQRTETASHQTSFTRAHRRRTFRPSQAASGHTAHVTQLPGGGPDYTLSTTGNVTVLI